ncbi:hypothetical protein FJY93_00340 [Candidatus Kaiserbacteria bacterium]|nr:hypothetical protein [Candidatus Kaiserbacteria bacterium]
MEKFEKPKKRRAGEQVARALGAALVAASPSAAQAGSGFDGNFPTHHYEMKVPATPEGLEAAKKRQELEDLRDKFNDYGLPMPPELVRELEANNIPLRDPNVK